MNNLNKTAPLDLSHVSVENPSQPDPTVETQDGQGILEGHSQQPNVAPEDLGGQAERDVKTNSKVTLGRHITSDPGEKVRERRHQHLKTTREENQKVFDRSKAGKKKRQ